MPSRPKPSDAARSSRRLSPVRHAAGFAAVSASWTTLVVAQRPSLWVAVSSGVASLWFTVLCVFRSVEARMHLTSARRHLDSAQEDHCADTDDDAAERRLLMARIAWHDSQSSATSLARAMLAFLALLASSSVWSSGLERYAHPSRTAGAPTYVLNAGWHILDVVPVVDLPALLHQPDPPIRNWGVATGLSLVAVTIATVVAAFEWARRRFYVVGSAEDEGRPEPTVRVRERPAQEPLDDDGLND